MVSVLASCAGDRSSGPNRIKPKTMKLTFVSSPLDIKEKEQRLVGSNQDNVSEWGDMPVYPRTVASVR